MADDSRIEDKKRYNAPFLRAFDYLAKEMMVNQDTLAKVIGGKSSYISALKSGTKRAGEDYMNRLAVAFAKHFKGNQHLNIDYLLGESDYMILENVPDDEVLERMHRESNPDYDVMKQQQQSSASAMQPHQPTAFENSVFLEKAISAATAYQDKLISTLEKQVADKDIQIEDLRRDVMQRDKTIAAQANRIQELEAIAKLYYEQNPSNDWPFPLGVADKNDIDPAHV